MQSSIRILQRIASRSSSYSFSSKTSCVPTCHPIGKCRGFHSSIPLQQGLDEPTEPDVPRYDVLNIQMKGYDFPVLERFARYVHKTAERVGLVVEDSWATPAQNLKVTKLKPESSIPESEYLLSLYERNVQVVEVPATILPVLVNIVESSMPPGVTLRVHPHLPEYTEMRYVPDFELKELKQQLQDMVEHKKK